MGNTNIQQLLNEQAALAKKIAYAYNAEERRDIAMYEFKAEIQARKQRSLNFMQKFKDMNEQKITDALKNAGWIKQTEDRKEATSSWVKKDSSQKLTITNGTWHIVDGVELKVKSQPLDKLIPYLTAPITQPELNSLK